VVERGKEQTLVHYVTHALVGVELNDPMILYFIGYVIGYALVLVSRKL